MIILRTFHIFKIKKEYAILTKNNAYYLFKMLNSINKLDEENISIGVNMFFKITDNFNIEELDKKLYKTYKDNESYTKFKNRHSLNSYLEKEETKLVLHNNFLNLKSNINHPTFFNSLSYIDNIFVCDFKNYDYFWLEKITKNLVK